MLKDMLGKLFAGQLRDLIEKLSGDEGEEWYAALKKFLRKENPWPAVAEKAKQALLKLVATVIIGAIKTFLAEDKYNVGEVDGVKIGWIGENFQRVFGNKVEKSVPEATLRIHKLLKNSVDEPILAELGEAAETALAQIWEMLKSQGHGQQGKLLVNGWANIFYVKDDNGQLWAVHCRWSSRYGYWHVEAYSVTDSRQWDDDYQVVSR